MGHRPALPRTLYSADECRALDKFAIDSAGIPGLELMKRAGSAAFDSLCKHWPDAKTVLVVCGLGNNAGDGYVLARLAWTAGYDVRIAQMGDAAELRGDARRAWEALESRVPVEPAVGCAHFETSDIIVDAVFGTGLSRQVEGVWFEVLQRINAAGRPVLALDLPSGLNADTGSAHGAVVAATVTVTFIGIKRGMLTALGPASCGHIELHKLGIPREVYAAVAGSAQRLELARLEHKLEPRPRHYHKGDCGHVLVVGGDLGYAGAARLAGEAAARVGAGLVSIATRSQHVDVYAVARPELMTCGTEDAAALAQVAERATVVAIGPGLGRSNWSTSMWSGVDDFELPMVVDADALNTLASSPVSHDHWVLTPHPGEAARLLGCTSREVQADRFSAVAELVQTYGGVVVLKGCGTLVAARGRVPEVCSQGNPGMASGGMGDVLTGVIAGLLAQGLSTWDAARLGVCLHAAAADAAAIDGERGLLAMDLMPALRRFVNPRLP